MFSLTSRRAGGWRIVLAALCLAASVGFARGQEEGPVTLRLRYQPGLASTVNIAGMAIGKFSLQLGQNEPAQANMIMTIDLGMETRVVEALEDGSGRLAVKITEFAVDNMISDENPKTPDVNMSMKLTAQGMTVTVGDKTLTLNEVPLPPVETVLLSVTYQGSTQYFLDLDLGQQVGEMTIELSAVGETCTLRPADEGQQPAQPQKLDLAKLLAEPLVMHIDARGRVLGVQGTWLDAIQKTMGQGGPGFVDLLRLGQGLLPDHPVRVGETWQTTTTTIDERTGTKLEMAAISRLAGIERRNGHRIARIEGTSVLKITSPPLTEEQQKRKLSETKMDTQMSVKFTTTINPPAGA